MSRASGRIGWKGTFVACATAAAVLAVYGAPPDSAPSAVPADSAKSLSLVEAQRIALWRNWDVLAAKSDVDIAMAQRIVAREFPNPTASLGLTKISVDDHRNSTGMGNGLWERSYDTVAAVNQLVEIGGKRRARQDSAAAGLKGAEARLADARRSLEQGVAQAYVAALLAERNRQVLTNSAASLLQEAAIAAARERAGDISTADRSQIEIAAQRLQLDAEAAAAAARNARTALETLLGMKQPDGSIQLSSELETLAEVRATVSNPVTAVMTRPDVVAAQEAQRKAEADLRLQKAQRVPDPTFFAQYEHEPPDLPNSVGFGLSFPLPLWNRNRGNIGAAQAALEQARVQVEKVQAQAAAEVAVAQNSYASAVARWRGYRDDLTPKSRQIRDSVAYAYEKGGATLLDLLTAQHNDNDVRLAAAQAAADAATAASALRAALNAPGATSSNP